jgi:glycosyltransferase involved in cell wall biosynthesis
MVARTLSVVLVSYMDLTGPGVMHLYHFAHELVRLGHRVCVLLNGDPATVRLMAEPPAFPVVPLLWQDGRLAPPTAAAVVAFKPQIVHAWTPRNAPAHAALEVAQRTGAHIVIHYEDDEDYLYRRYAPRDLLHDRDMALRSLVQPELWAWQHPLVSTAANQFARAFTAICKPYVARLQRTWAKPVHLLYPGVDLQRFHPEAAPVDRARYGLAGKTVVLYSGSLAPVHGFELMLEGFARVAPRRPEAMLVHIGRNLMADELAIEVRRLGLAGRVLFLGPVEHHAIHHHLALGDVLVQSGAPGDFNEYRLPSKLPEYFAMGRAVVTFAAGIGREFTDGVDVLKTHTGDPAELAERVETVLADADLRARLGQGARRRAEELFSWPRNAAGLSDFYQDLLDERLPAPSAAAAASAAVVAAQHWPGFALAPEAPPFRDGSLSRDGQDAAQADLRVLVVAADALPLAGPDGAAGQPALAPGATGRRSAAWAAALSAAGHTVFQAMPLAACPESLDLRPFPQVRLWQWRTLPFVVQSLEAEVVLLCGWPALSAFAQIALPMPPAVADLADMSPHATQPPPDERLAALAKTRAALVPDAEARLAWLPWGLLAGCEIACADPAGAQAGAGVVAAEAVAVLERVVRAAV